jgi:hypothetical protein
VVSVLYLQYLFLGISQGVVQWPGDFHTGKVSLGIGQFHDGPDTTSFPELERPIHILFFASMVQDRAVKIR